MSRIKIVFLILTIVWVSKASSETLDILVLYPSSVKNQYANGEVAGKINHYILWTNTAFANSGINININLLHHQVVDLPNSGDVNDDLLLRLWRDSNVMNIRNIYKPHLTMYLAHQSSQWCGKAYFPAPQPIRSGSYLRVREMAFKAVAITAANCGADTFAHEIGHNLGAGHGRKQNDDGHPIKTNRGWGVEHVFTTIMPYPEVYNAPRLQYFSNPNKLLCNSLPCGTSIDNAASGMTEIVADYIQFYNACYPTRKAGRGEFCGYHLCLRPGGRSGCLEWM